MAQYYPRYILHMRQYINGIVLSKIFPYICGIISMAQNYPIYLHTHVALYQWHSTIPAISYTRGIIIMAQYYPRYILHIWHYINGIVLSKIYPTHVALYQWHSTIHDISYTCIIISMAQYYQRYLHTHMALYQWHSTIQDISYT